MIGAAKGEESCMVLEESYLPGAREKWNTMRASGRVILTPKLILT
jgi:hypothetical protein